MLALFIAASKYIVPRYPALQAAAAARPFPGLVSALLPAPQPYVSFGALLAAGLYAIVTLLLIYRFFEKTQSPEMFFFAFLAFSFAFEPLHIIIPLREVFALPIVYVEFTGRVILFGRYMGVFSFFAASVYAAGLKTRNESNVLLPVVISALLIALRSPVDGMSWDSSISLILGDQHMYMLMETALVFITIVDFFVSAYLKGSRDYIFIGMGASFVLLGRILLLSCDTWIFLVMALVFLGAGTWFFCSRIHRMYMWL
jgi:hypothetical protein